MDNQVAVLDNPRTLGKALSGRFVGVLREAEESYGPVLAAKN